MKPFSGIVHRRKGRRSGVDRRTLSSPDLFKL